jgi:hypothetical protein
MSIESPSNWPAADQPPLLTPPRRRWPMVLVVLLGLALAGAGAAYVWLNAGSLMPSAAREAADADTGANDRAIMTELLAAAQKSADDLAAIDKTIASQQDQLTAIVNQLADLNAKIEALKGPAPQVPAAPARAPATAAFPPATPPQVAAPPAAARVPPRPKRPPQAAAPSGPISVGGAPLTTTPDTVR